MRQFRSLCRLVFILTNFLVYACGPKTFDTQSNFSQYQGPKLAQFDSKFIFGVASASAHVEDGLDDAWLDWGKKGYIAGFFERENANGRLGFWSKPEIEIENASLLGFDLFRLGIDWSRLAPEAPGSLNCRDASGVATRCPIIQNMNAWNHYRKKVFAHITRKKMKIMLSLFHHSAPQWFVNSGGWTNTENRLHFIDFAKTVIDLTYKEGIHIDYWITINEPTVMSIMSYGLRLWPNHYKKPKKINIFDFVNIGPIRADVQTSDTNMAYAHNELYRYIHDLDEKAIVSIAKNFSDIKTAPEKTKKLIGKASAPLIKQIRYFYNFRFLALISDKIDFIGINYYGEEFLGIDGFTYSPEREYMDSGRAISPNGLYRAIMETSRFVETRGGGKKPIFVTENGISDSRDVLRPSYFVESLLSLKHAESNGHNILGYVVWTLTDNLEWSDGYCPKFGLFSVPDNGSDIYARKPRSASTRLWRNLLRNRWISQSDREDAWSIVVKNQGQARPMCRGQNGIQALPQEDTSFRVYTEVDWRFTQ